jgi:predicted HTH domain antitoxin
MTLHIPIPDGLDDATVHDLDKTAREAVAVQLYRQGKLSHGRLAVFLGIGRGEVDELLGRYGVLDEFSASEIADQVNISRELRQRAQ